MPDRVECSIDVGKMQDLLPRALIDIRVDHQRDQEPGVLPFNTYDTHRRSRLNVRHVPSMLERCHCTVGGSRAIA